MEQKASYAKSKQATEPQTYTYIVTIGGYTHSEFHAIPLHGYGETPSKLSIGGYTHSEFHYEIAIIIGIPSLLIKLGFDHMAYHVTTLLIT